MTNNRRILSVGTLVIDRINGEQHIGGEAANVAWNLVQLGLPSSLLTVLGEDTESERIQGVMRDSGVLLHSLSNKITRLPECHVSMGSDGKETGYEWFGNGVEETFIQAKVPIELCKENKSIYIGSVEPEYATRLVAALPGHTMYYNPGTRIFENPSAFLKIYSHCKLVFMNVAEATFVLQHMGQDAFENFFSDTDQVIIITEGKKGVTFIANKQIKKYSAHVVEAIDETGAGDAFASGTVWALEHGYSLERAMYAGLLLASKVVQQVGAKITPKIAAEFIREFK